MTVERKKDRLFWLFIIIVLCLAIVYFTVPERKNFFDFQLRWWGEAWDVLASLFSRS